MSFFPNQQMRILYSPVTVTVPEAGPLLIVIVDPDPLDPDAIRVE